MSIFKNTFDPHGLYTNISATKGLICLMLELLLSAQGEWIYPNFIMLLHVSPTDTVATTIAGTCHMAADKRCHSVNI